MSLFITVVGLLRLAQANVFDSTIRADIPGDALIPAETRTHVISGERMTEATRSAETTHREGLAPLAGKGGALAN